MELNLEVVLSSSIKRKKPWPRFCWLGQEKESVFLLDDKRISEINMVSGHTKKRTPKLHPLLSSVVTMASSHSGTWLCGVLVSGELFLWNRDKDLLKSAAAAPDIVQVVSHAQGKSIPLRLQVSDDGMRVLLVAITGQVFLWECMDVRDLTGVRDGTVKGCWAYIKPLEDTILPSPRDKEASQHSIFVKTEAVGDACLLALVFTSGKKLIITCLKIQWEEGHMIVGSVGYSIEWATKTYTMSHLTPPCQPVKSRGALVPAFSPDGQLLAIVLNQRQPKATQVLYVSMQNFVSVSSGLGGCGIKTVEIPSKYIRSYWVGSVSWSPSSLFLACVLKRGSFLMLVRLGGLLTLTTSGCNVDFGPAHFLPLHPLVTYWPPVSAGKDEASLSSSSLSVQDVLRQRYSVTWHPRLFYLIVSDGYMATVMRVQDMPSPALLLKTLLKETTRDLEKASQIRDQSQIHVRAWLESVSSLNFDSSSESLNPSVTYGPNTADSVYSAATDGSTLPLFLQDTGTMGGTKGLLEKMQTFLEDDSDLDGPPAGSHIKDGGRLEFASMFDTLHALDTDTGLVTGPDYDEDFVEAEEKNFPLRELGKIQSKLLTAWAFGMSVGNGMMEHRVSLLRHNLYGVVRLAALFHLIPSSLVHTGKKNTSVFARLLHLIKALLSFLHWDHAHSDGSCCLGLMVEFSKRLVHLLLTPHPEFYQTGHLQLSSQSLSNTLHILQMVSQSLDDTYSLQQQTVWSSAEKEPPSKPLQLWPSDVHNVPLLQDEKEKNPPFLHSGRPVPHRPSSRLIGVWQWVYNIAQQYLDELKGFEDCDGWEEEQERLSVIMSQMQTALQSAGGRLEEGPALLGYPGEHLFLSGSYQKSADAWQSQIHEDTNKNGDRRIFLETRLCLALLYSFLFQYRLREAQELGDHMANLILQRAGHQKDDIKYIAAGSLPCSWLPDDLHCDAAFAVVQSLGRFMASYFANQPLHILPPHNVTILPPLHLPYAPSIGRLVPLCQEEVATAVRRQHLSDIWTVDYTQDLLLLGGLLPEAAWLADHLGDWKMAVSLSLAYKTYCTDNIDFARLRRRELHLPTALEAENIFQAELECLLNNKPDSQEHTDKNGDKSFTEPLEGQDWDLLLVSIQEILKASVMAGVNVMSSPLSSLLDTAKNLCSSLHMLVPSGLYLPSPPLYCPQPSPNTQDPIQTIGQFAEIASRHKVSGVLQRLLLLLRSARCCHPAAQWYITHLRRARHLLYKIKKKYSYPGGAEEERALPEGLMKFVTRRGFFRRGPNKNGHLDPDIIQTISSFRELCALCWMLHVRDQLSISCRKYQAARQFGRDGQVAGDSEVRSCCVEALLWARRFLPFSHFLNAEEILQDLLLSLLSELPPIPLVADTLVEAFPEEEESVRVSLREKYNSLLQKLRPCNVLEGEKAEINELMMILIQDKQRQRKKHLGRLRRHLAPTELHLWEKEEEVEDRGSKHGMAMLRQLSLGTSLSTSTLTDCGFPPVYSDGDTAETTSEAFLPENHCRSKSRPKKGYKIRARKDAVKIESAIQEESKADNKGYDESSLPVVGTWEFELDDEEYLNFLELFLSYELEKDSADGGDQGSELPLLKSFSKQLRERELHSLTFDVLTTIHRRQREGHHPGEKHRSTVPPVFRAGSCYRPMKGDATPEPQTSSIWSEAPISRTSHSVSSLPGLRNDRQRGLFGLRKQTHVPISQRVKGSHWGSETSPIKSNFLVGPTSESLIFSPSTSVEPVIELQQGLDPKLEAQFPQLGRLLEWMVRWADRRMLLGHHGKKKKERGGGVGGINDRVVIRVKSSAPAVLTSLSLLEWRYTTLLGTDCYSAHLQVPETQWTVAPVLQPEVDRKLERDSSIDTGYPGSASTPLTGPDPNLQQGEVSISGCCTDEPEDELGCDRLPLPHEQHQQTFDTLPAQSCFQQPPPDDLDVTPEKEGKSSCSDISEGFCTSVASLKLAELDLPPSAEDILTSTSVSLQAPAQPQPQPPPLSIAQPEDSVHSETSESTGMRFSTTPADPSSLQPQSSRAGAPAGVSTAANQPPFSQSTPMRQRLGEDLYHLVQHINYMSLMEVLGASFSNLQLAQQSCSLAQSNMNSSQPNVPPSSVTGFIPQPNAFPVQPTISVAPQPQSVLTPGFNKPYFSQAPACMSADQPAAQSSGNKPPTHGPCHITSALSTSASGACGNNQEMRPLSIHVESPEIQFKQSRKLIPPSRGLLATTDSQTVPSAPVLPHSTGSFRNDAAPQVLGLKLLQLQFPSLPQQTARHYHPVKESQMMYIANTATQESHQPKLRHGHPAGAQMAKDEKRITSSVPRRQLSFNHTQEPDRNWHHQIHTSDMSRGQEFSLPRPTLPVHTPAATQGLRLLHFQPAAQSNITFPKLPIPFSPRPATVIRAPVGETPLIKLLHIKSGPKMILPMAAPTQMTRLISMDELTSSVIRSENNTEAQPQLLKVNPLTEGSRAATASFGSNSSKRQRRREDKAERARKSVSFTQNESITPTQKSTDEPAKVAEEITPSQNFAFPPGSFDCMLTGQSLLDKAMSTSAELHAFASTCKTPPECKDAFTNTDSVCPSNVEKRVSTVVTSTGPKSQSTQHCEEGTDHIVQDINETPKHPEKMQDLPGHQFISVLDLEDKSLHHDLPLRLSPEAQDVPSIQPSSPTSAQLHVLATSVIRGAAAAAADPQPSITLADNFLKPTTQLDIPEEPQLPSHMESTIEPERITPQDVTDPFDSEIFQAIKKPSVGSHRASASPPAAWFSSRLSELDVQLAALQKIADYLENDFSNSRILVNTIETLTPVLVPDEKRTMAVKKTVRLSVPKEAWTPQSDVVIQPHTCKEEEESQKDKHVIHSDSHTTEGNAAFHHFTPHRHRAEIKSSGISPTLEEEDLGQTGLLDTIEILDELVKEGYLSPTELDLSNSQTAHDSSSLHQQQSSIVSQKIACPEDERRELRIWMRRKQRERLAVYQKHKESLKEREQKPSSASGKATPTKKNQSTISRTRGEKEKFMLLEQYNRRIHEACSLVSGLSNTPPVIRRSPQPEVPPLTSTAKSTSTPPFGGTYRAYSTSANDKSGQKPQSKQTQPPHPRITEVQGQPSEGYSRRLGLHRPVTSLPRDRQSQVTRRGMITDTKNNAKLLAASQSEVHDVVRQRKTRLNKTTLRESEIHRGQTKVKDGDEMALREPKSEPNKRLGQEESESNMVVATILDVQGDGARAGVSDMDWLDNLSETGSSNLSKVDWAAIERMVASEED